MPPHARTLATPAEVDAFHLPARKALLQLSEQRLELGHVARVHGGVVFPAVGERNDQRRFRACAFTQFLQGLHGFLAREHAALVIELDIGDEGSIPFRANLVADGTGKISSLGMRKALLVVLGQVCRAVRSDGTAAKKQGGRERKRDQVRQSWHIHLQCLLWRDCSRTQVRPFAAMRLPQCRHSQPAPARLDLLDPPARRVHHSRR